MHTLTESYDISDIRVYNMSYTMSQITLQIASDLHLEVCNPFDFDRIVQPSADVLALVGDIGSPLHSGLESFLDWCSCRFQQVYFVHGNHELYTTDSSKDVQKLITMMEELCAKWDNVIYLNNRVHIYHGVCFIGSTLWSHIPNHARWVVSQRINDYRRIYSRPHVLYRIDDSNAEYEKNKKFLESAINEAVDHGFWPVVLTHHVPWIQGTSDPQYEGQAQTYAFATDFPGSSNHIQLWVAGHTHYNFHHQLAGYELISNQCGYPNDVSNGYDSAFCRTVFSRKPSKTNKQ
jgi:UDP-2,3-diacylglucosamine pyrophosphatase LpxH